MKRSTRRSGARSAFAAILAELLRRMPRANAAVLVDPEGETVDYACKGSAFFVKLAAAEWQLVFQRLRGATQSLGQAHTLALQAMKKTFAMRSLPEGYALLAILDGTFPMDSLAVDACVNALIGEARWPNSARTWPAPEWTAIQVRCDSEGRPRSLRTVHPRHSPAPNFERVTILGVIPNPHSRCSRPARGFRVHLASGQELTVIREGSACWYADQIIFPKQKY